MLAETPQIPVGIVILVLVVFLLTIAAALAVVVGGWIAAYRCGRDPARIKARVVASVCGALEAGALGWATLVVIDDPDAAPALLAVAAVLMATGALFVLGMWLRVRDLRR